MRFILTATALIGLLHLYVGLRILPALGLGAAGLIAGGLLLALSTVLIPLGLSGRIPERVITPLAWSGLLAAGLASSLLVLAVVRDLLLLPAMLLLSSSTFTLVEHDSAWSVPVGAALLSLVGLINARRLPQVVEVDIPVPGLPADLHGFRIVQLSDIHVGRTIRRGFLERVVTRVNSLAPNVVAITGDLVDGTVEDLAQHTAALADLRAEQRAYFVTGNHEYYSGADAWVTELRRLGIRVLENEHVMLPQGDATLMLAGVTDYSAHHFDERQRSDPLAAAAGAPASAGARVLLAHQPRSAPATEAAGFHLQLSGHTHGGQFFPWIAFVRLQQPYTAGLHRLNNLWVYTSRGTGYWGPPKRLGAPSEITLLRLVAA